MHILNYNDAYKLLGKHIIARNGHDYAFSGILRLTTSGPDAMTVYIDTGKGQFGPIYKEDRLYDPATMELIILPI